MPNFTDASDVVMHNKENDGNRLIFPITRYQNLLGAPTHVKSLSTLIGAPFLLLETETVSMTEEELYELSDEFGRG